MKRRSKTLSAAAALILLLIVGHFVFNMDGWGFRLPVIEGSSARNEKTTPIAKPVTAVGTNGANDRKLSAIGNPRPASNATTFVSMISTTKQKTPKDPEATPPYWCFRTYFPGLPWIMNTDERNTGNTARSDSEFIWNGERSLRMDFAPIDDGTKASYAMLRAQRNVLWQAIRAAPFRGKRIAFRPTLRATPGAILSVFLRSWDGKTGTPQLSYDKSNPATTPSVIWGGAWGSARLLLDVPMDAEIIYYGIVQSCGLPVWIDHAELAADPAPGTLSAAAYLRNMGTYLEGLPPLPIDPDENDEVPEDTPPLPC